MAVSSPYAYYVRRPKYKPYEAAVIIMRAINAVMIWLIFGSGIGLVLYNAGY